MSKLLLSSALVVALCGLALATPIASTPIAGAGLPIIAVGLGGLGLYWLVSRRQRDL